MDVLVVRPPHTQYATRHANAEDTLLVVEVSVSTLRYDRGEKLRAYARTGIAEYWILDVARGRLHVFTEPDGERYRSQVLVERGGRIAPRAFPDDAIAFDDVLPPGT